MNKTFVVLRKEVREVFKDKRVVRTVFLTPFMMMFFMTQLLSFVIGTVKTTAKASTLAMVMPGGENLISKALGSGGAEIKIVKTVDEGKALIKEGKAKVVIEFPSDFGEQFVAHKAVIKTYFDGNQESSQIVVSGIEKAIQKINEESAKETLKANNLSPDALESIKVEKQDLATKKGGEFLMQLMPYLMILTSFIAGMAFAADVVAGEKERLTLETLLLTPVQRTQILLGKYLALAGACVIAAINTLIAVNVFGRMGAVKQIMFPEGAGFDVQTVLGILGAMVPLALFFAGLLLAVSSYAKNMRECQGYLGVAMTFVTIPAIMSQFVGIASLGQTVWIKFVPILNASLVIRQSFEGKVDMMTVLGALTTSLVLAAVGYGFAVRMFQSEKVLNRI